MPTDDRIKALAKWYYDRLHTNKRANGDEYYKFTGTGDDAQRKADIDELRAALHDSIQIAREALTPLGE